MSRQQEVQERGRRTGGEDARARLLAGLPVTERREQLAGMSTAVLEGGDDPPGHRAGPARSRGFGGVRPNVAEAASVRYGWPLHVVENARDDPAIEQPEAFLEALDAALDD